jgi:hypothetical protein
MNKLIKTTLAAAVLTIAASTAMAFSSSASCGGGTCQVTINGVTTSYPGKSAKVITTSVKAPGGITGKYYVYVDGKLVDTNYIKEGK